MSERTEKVAQAICRVDYEQAGGVPWDHDAQCGQDIYLAEAAAAIHAYRTLTNEQWEEFGEIILHISDIDDALTALGFRRADEVESAS